MARSESDGRAHEISVRVMSLRYAGPDTVLFELEALDMRPLPEAAPGAHIDVRISSDTVRQYSLITPLSTPSVYVVAIRRDAHGRGGSKRIHDDIKPGAVLQISPPRNHFALNEHARKNLLIAGGIGITPIYSMFARLREQNRDVELHYWCRSPEHALFRTALEAAPNAQLHYSGADVQDRTTLASVLAQVPHDVEIYCCGPQRMLDDFERLTSGRPDTNVHVERFSAASAASAASVASVVPVVPVVPATKAFTVMLKRSEAQVEVREGESILSALLRADIDVPYSCEEGVCGACETRVLAGQPLHRDTVRTPHEHDRRSTMMICCSGSDSPCLTLDL
jgi:vanillate O-demethylase ferredoxin subunit